MTNLIKIAALGMSAFATIAATTPSGGVGAGSSAVASSAAVARGGQGTGADTKKYCRMMEPISGSRVGKRACKTKAEWAEEGIQIGAKN